MTLMERTTDATKMMSLPDSIKTTNRWNHWQTNVKIAWSALHLLYLDLYPPFLRPLASPFVANFLHDCELVILSRLVMKTLKGCHTCLDCLLFCQGTAAITNVVFVARPIRFMWSS